MAFRFMGMRPFSSKVFVQGIPAEWDEHEVNARFSIAGPLNRVHFVKSAQGLRTGKVVIEYTNKDSADNAISRFDNKAVDGLICAVKPFYTKQDEKPRKNESMLARRVYLMNLQYETTNAEIESLVSEFAAVDQVVIPRDKTGLTRGYAFVYLEKEGDV